MLGRPRRRPQVGLQARLGRRLGRPRARAPRGDAGAAGGGARPRRAKRPAPEGRLDLRNSWQVVAGSILIPLGVVFILIGWYGAAHARVVQQQIPYLVSGSFIGLGCMVVGGLLFWGHWLYRMYDQADLHHEEQQRLLELIAASLVCAADRRAAAGRRRARPGPSRRRALYATTTGSVYHRAGLRRDRAPPRRPAGARCGRADRDAALPDLPARLTAAYGSATSMTMSSSSPGAGGVYRWAARTSSTHPTTA